MIFILIIKILTLKKNSEIILIFDLMILLYKVVLVLKFNIIQIIIISLIVNITYLYYLDKLY